MNNDFKIIESPFMQIIADLVKNNKNLTPRLQDAIADYMVLQIKPIMTVHTTDTTLLEGEESHE